MINGLTDVFLWVAVLEGMCVNTSPCGSIINFSILIHLMVESL